MKIFLLIIKTLNQFMMIYLDSPFSHIHYPSVHDDLSNRVVVVDGFQGGFI